MSSKQNPNNNQINVDEDSRNPKLMKNKYTELQNFQQGNDKNLREKLQKIDEYDQQKVQDQYDKEEKELKKFFNNLKEPVKEDPTIMRKKRYQEKMSSYKDAVEGLNLKNLIKSFWSFNPPTPEEIETLYDCRQYTKKNMFIYSSLGLTVTGITSFYNRRYLGLGLHIFSIGIGVLGGSIFGLIKSTEYSLRRMESLGPDFILGRLAINEIQDFRLDKKTKQIIQ